MGYLGPGDDTVSPYLLRHHGHCRNVGHRYSRFLDLLGYHSTAASVGASRRHQQGSVHALGFHVSNHLSAYSLHDRNGCITAARHIEIGK